MALVHTASRRVSLPLARCACGRAARLSDKGEEKGGGTHLCVSADGQG